MATLLEIQSYLRRYTVEVRPNLKDAVKALKGEGQSFLLIDEQVARLYPESLLEDHDKVLRIKATEEQKSYHQIAPLIEELIRLGMNKSSRLLVIGGGVTQDIGCFIASIFNRGIPWDFIPTTLLAQCDSCIGSKSSINIGPFKNQLGTFYPPQKVALVFPVLNTLSETEICSGLGEIIKLGLIAGNDQLNQMKSQIQKLKQNPSQQTALLGELVLQSLKIKKVFIEEDEFDQGVRNLLNYGHTFGHAYESATQYKIPHGIAVLLGMSTATYFSEKLSLVPSNSFNELNSWVRDLYSPFHKLIGSSNIEDILKAMKTDKKNSQGKVNCILTHGPGTMKKHPLDLENEIRPLLKTFIKELHLP